MRFGPFIAEVNNLLLFVADHCRKTLLNDRGEKKL